MVAAKIILHAPNDKHSTMDSQHLQCLLAANHPNVVACYRVWTDIVGPLGEGPSSIAPLGEGASSLNSVNSVNESVKMSVNTMMSTSVVVVDDGESVEGGGSPRAPRRRSLGGLQQTTLLLEYCDGGTLRRAVRDGRFMIQDAEGDVPDVVCVWREW